MIKNKLIDSVKEFAYKEIETYGAPSKFQVDFTNEKGQLLSEKLNANKNIVLLGTLLMDCKLGRAYKEGRLQDHIEMSKQKADEILSSDKDITNEEKLNILNFISQHHGSDKFSSLESEMCCNADCYKFASIKGVIGGIKNLRDMPLDDLVKLFINKADEKWNALSLEICKSELKTEYEAIKNFLMNYRIE